MKKLVYSEKEQRYVELEFSLDQNGQKVYNNSIQSYDQYGNIIKVLSIEEREEQFVRNLENSITKDSYAKTRIDICKNCDNYSYKFCKVCKCFLPFKVLIKNTSCPLKKWNNINE